MKRNRKKIAFIHRYGLEGWVCCGGHAIPCIVKNLSKEVEIHFYGPRVPGSKNQDLRAMIQMHELPYTWDRSNPCDKITKTLLWYLSLPIIGVRCRLNGTSMIWNDETVPLTAPVLQLCFGKNIAITVMDFFVRIYTEKHPRLRWVRDLVERIDFAAWKKLPIIFTKALYTQAFLAEHGVPKKVMHLYRNPVDPEKFHPVDASTRKATRERLGFTETDIVLSHHGILHPNKGNDWILHRMEELKDEMPNLKYLLIGNGSEMHPLKRLAAELDIADRVIFTGWLPYEEDLNNTLASADIGLVMRTGQATDHFHMTDTLAHEMACGKPILAVDLKGIAEVIHDGDEGFLFSPVRAEEFLARIRHLANESTRAVFAERSFRLGKNICNIHTCTQEFHAIMTAITSHGP